MQPDSYFKVWQFVIHIQSISVALGLTLGTYVVWREARKEGFDEEQVFDMVVSGLLGGVFIARLVYAVYNVKSFLLAVIHVVKFWTPGIDLPGFLTSLFLIVYVWVKAKKWSIYRILDIFAMGITIGVSPVILAFGLLNGRYELVILFGLILLFHSILVTLRDKKFVFGGLFSLFLIQLALTYSFFNRETKSLILAGFLFTLGGGLLVKRLRNNKILVHMGISKEFLNNIKNALLQKEKELDKEERLLKKEDSYNQPDRDVLNSEVEDEAIEDESHIEKDIIGDSIKEMRHQIKRALARINIGTYGICEVCHKPIDEARLRAFPQATTCLECSEKKTG